MLEILYGFQVTVYIGGGDSIDGVCAALSMNFVSYHQAIRIGNRSSC